MFVCMYVHTCAYLAPACEGQTRALDLLGLQLQVVVSHIWVLGIEPLYSGRAANALND